MHPHHGCVAPPRTAAGLPSHNPTSPALIGILMFAMVVPALAWNPPPTQEHRGLPTIAGERDDTPVLTYFADAAWENLYSPKGHGYIIQHAVELLRADGYGNWADVAQANQMHLLSGAAHADNYLGRIRALFQLEVLWGLFSWDVYEYDITCRAGCEHYHNVSDGKGLQMPIEATLADIFDWFVFRYFLSVGPASIDMDIVPELQSQYPSAVMLCQKHFTKAQNIWRLGSFIYPSRSATESAFYELGWACHLLADQAVVQHQHNAFFGGHSDYENAADGHGNARDYPNCHASSAVPFGAYKHGPAIPGGPWEAYDYARTVAEKIYHEPGHYDLAENGNTAQREQALNFAIPLAEAYTAGLLARFMSETGVPATSPPLSGYVRGENGATIPGAYVFYADAGSTVKIDQNVPDVNPVDRWKSWDMVRADSQSRYTLPAQPDNYYLLRAANPDHCFEGKTSSNLEFGERKCPVVYYQQRGM
ncbi:MAG: hypothetical protein QM473_17525 [Acidobacteriota bacterium]|nr:hypothetical protein [Acidobacteriota bacterium]